MLCDTIIIVELIVSIAIIILMLKRKLMVSIILFVAILFINNYYSNVMPGCYNGEFALAVLTIISALSFLVTAMVVYRHNVIMWILISIFLLPLLLASVLLGPFGILFYSSIIAAWISARNNVEFNVLSAISSSLKQNMPLNIALRQATVGLGGKSSKILNGISDWLSQGYSLSDSLKKVYRRCPGRILSLLETAEDSGQLPRAAMYLERQIYDKQCFGNWRNWNFQDLFMYPFIIVLVLVSLLLYMAVFILPMLMAMCRDIGGELPQVTLQLLGFIKYLFDYSILFYGLWVLILFMLMMRLFYVRRPDNPAFLSRFVDTIKWYCPLLHWFEKTVSYVRILEYLQLAEAGGLTMDKTLANCLKLDVNLHFRRRLQNWHVQVLAGVPVSKAAREVGMSEAFVWAIDGETGPGNVGEALDMLEKNYSANLEYRASLLKEYLAPLVVIICSVMVGFVVYAMFLPMVYLIDATMGMM